MWWFFKKKKLYCIVWTYNTSKHSSNSTYKEIVKARDKYNAWKAIKREHAMPVSLISIEELGQSL